MTFTATIVCDRDFAIGAIDRRLFGSFIEHLGRAVYGGIYEPGHPTATADGFRGDVLALVRELGITVVRYPGGNFVSNYAWEDGVGPRADRPRRRELAWVSIETNQVGTDDFIDWCRLADVAPMLAVNLGTRGIAEAAAYLEYCNHPGGTELSERRIRNGHRAPHDVRLWCLGNEMDGHWQVGAKTAVEYGALARETAKVMRLPDPAQLGDIPAGPPIELVACGSSGRWMPTFGTWERQVLEQCYDQVDYLSLHTYYGDRDRDRGTFLASSHEMDVFIGEVVAICDAVKATRRSAKTIDLSFDEWNVWYHSNGPDRTLVPWREAPAKLEDRYDAADALVVGGMLIALLNHADRVKIACLAQLVNVIAPIMTRTGGPAWRQTIFHPFAQVSAHGRGVALRRHIDAPTYATAQRKAVPLVDAAITHDAGGVVAFVLNRSIDQEAELRLELRGFAGLRLERWELLHEADLDARNSEEEPQRVRMREAQGARLADQRLTATLPPASWSVFRLVAATPG